MRLIIMFTLFATAADSQTFSCYEVGYCSAGGECEPGGSSPLIVQEDQNGNSRFGWNELGPLVDDYQKQGDLSIFYSVQMIGNYGEPIIQTLAIRGNGEASLFTTFVLRNKLSSSVSSLICHQ